MGFWGITGPLRSSVRSAMPHPCCAPGRGLLGCGLPTWAMQQSTDLLRPPAQGVVSDIFFFISSTIYFPLCTCVLTYTQRLVKPRGKHWVFFLVALHLIDQSVCLSVSSSFPFFLSSFLQDGNPLRLCWLAWDWLWSLAFCTARLRTPTPSFITMALHDEFYT